MNDKGFDIFERIENIPSERKIDFVYFFAGCILPLHRSGVVWLSTVLLDSARNQRKISGRCRKIVSRTVWIPLQIPLSIVNE